MVSSDKNTSWEDVSSWYGSITAKEGHYYHKHLIIPKLLDILDLDKESSLLDLGCGQGILSRAIPKHVAYTGLDLSKSLIAQAESLASSWSEVAHHKFIFADITKPYPIKDQKFTHAACVLALQNVEDPFSVFEHTQKHLAEKGLFVIVMNHPCYRIPRQSSWGIDEGKKLQYRRVDSYMSPLKIPIVAHPGKEVSKEKSPQTWSFHHPISTYLNNLYQAGFYILGMEEWVSPKISTGKMAKMENRAREEIPLFLTIIAEKQ